MNENIEKIKEIREGLKTGYLSRPSDFMLKAARKGLDNALSSTQTDNKQLIKETDIIIAGGIIVACAIYDRDYYNPRSPTIQDRKRRYPVSYEQLLSDLQGQESPINQIKHIGEKALSRQIPFSPENHKNVINGLSRMIKNNHFSKYNCTSEQDFIQEEERKAEEEAKLFEEVLSKLVTLTTAYLPNSKELHSSYESLVDSLHADYKESKEKVIGFYKKIEANNFRLLNEISKDTCIPSKQFREGIAIIAVTILTGILPGVLIMLLVVAATGKHVGNLFEAKKIGQELADKIQLTLTHDSIASYGFFKDTNNKKENNPLSNTMDGPK